MYPGKYINMLKKDKKSHFIIVRVTEKEKAFLAREARKHKIAGKISTFIRHILGLTKNEISDTGENTKQEEQSDQYTLG